MLLETLRADWVARGASARVSALPAFVNGVLTLGAGTKLAEARADRRDEVAEGERAVALVSVALGRPLDASAATHVRRAVAKARAGDAPLALTHLALAGAGRLTKPSDDARRLFIADGLMKVGVTPATIVAALGKPPAPADLDRAYDPDQPRVPAGSGRPSGQWTSGDWSGGSVADDMAPPASVFAGAAALRHKVFKSRTLPTIGPNTWIQSAQQKPQKPAALSSTAANRTRSTNLESRRQSPTTRLWDMRSSPAARPSWTFQASRRRASMISSCGLPMDS